MGNKRKADGSESVQPKRLKTVVVENDGKVVESETDLELISQKFRSMIKALAKVSKNKNIKEDEVDILDQSSETDVCESTMDETVPLGVNEGKDITSEVIIKDEKVDRLLNDVFKLNDREVLDDKFKSDLKKMEKIVKEVFEKKDQVIQKEQKKNKKLEASLKEMSTVRKELKKTKEVLELVQKKNIELEETIASKDKLIEKLIITNKENESKHKSEQNEKAKISKNKKIRFKLLLEARNRFFNYMNMRIEQMIEEKLYQLLKSAEGSVFFQENCHLATEDEKDILFRIINYNPASMANNKFGSLVLVDLVNIFSEQQKRELYHKMSPSFKPVLLNCYGSRVLQETFGSIPVDVQDLIITALSKDVIDYSKNVFASFVLQKVIEMGNFNESFTLKMSILKIQEEAPYLCTNKFGSRVIQKILTFAPEELTRDLKSSVYEILPKLIDHQYGNYIVQNLFEFGTTSDRKMVVDCCARNVLEMSLSKYASNVVQWILKAGSVDDKIVIIKEVSGKKELDVLTKNQYGNYVVQLIIENAEVCFLREIHDKIITIVEVDNTLCVEKLRMMVEDKFSKKNIVRLAKRFVKDEQSGRLREKFKSFERVIGNWMEDLLSYERMNVDNLMIPLFIEVLEDINDNEENCDLADLRQSLRVYLKELVAYQGKVQFGLFPTLGSDSHQNSEMPRTGSSDPIRHNYQDAGELHRYVAEDPKLLHHQENNHHQQNTQSPHLNTGNQHVPIVPSPNLSYSHNLIPQHSTPHQVYLAQPYPTISYQNYPHTNHPAQHHNQLINSQTNHSNYVNMDTLPTQHHPGHHKNPFHHQQNLPVQVQQFQNHPSSFHQGSHHQPPHIQVMGLDHAIRQ